MSNVRTDIEQYYSNFIHNPTFHIPFSDMSLGERIMRITMMLGLYGASAERVYQHCYGMDWKYDDTFTLADCEYAMELLLSNL